MAYLPGFCQIALRASCGNKSHTSDGTADRTWPKTDSSNAFTPWHKTSCLGNGISCIAKRWEGCAPSFRPMTLGEHGIRAMEAPSLPHT